MSQLEEQNTEKTDKSLKRQSSKCRSNYGVVNGSQDYSNDLTSMIPMEVSLPRSETIGAIGHRPYTGDTSAMYDQHENPGKKKEKNEEDVICRKCGHCMKKE